MESRQGIWFERVGNMSLCVLRVCTPTKISCQLCQALSWFPADKGSEQFTWCLTAWRWLSLCWCCFVFLLYVAKMYCQQFLLAARRVFFQSLSQLIQCLFLSVLYCLFLWTQSAASVCPCHDMFRGLWMIQCLIVACVISSTCQRLMSLHRYHCTQQSNQQTDPCY